MKCNLTRKRFLSSLILSAGFALFPSLVLASYQPGQTLDPACPPSDDTCVVIASTSTSSPWTTSGSNISYSAGNVGIGTTSPFTTLAVTGNAYFNGTLTANAGSFNTLTTPGLPNLSSSVEGTGVPGLDNAHWFIWNDPGTFDPNPTLRVDRHADTGSGISGNTYKAIWANASTGANNAGYEWAITGQMQNEALASNGAQNVAVNGTIFKVANGIGPVGPSWGGNFDCSDQTLEANPVASCIGAELDVNTTSSTTDNNRQRVGLQIAGGGVAGAHIGYGILMGASAGAIIDRGLSFQGSGTAYGIGIDAAATTFSIAPVFLGSNQKIVFDGNASGAYARSLSYNGTSLGYVNASTTLFSVGNTGTTVLGDASGTVSFVPTDVTNTYSMNASGNLNIGFNGGGAVTFLQGATNRLTIAANGEVGIGTSSPTAGNLVVAGSSVDLEGNNPAYKLYSTGAHLTYWNLQALDANNDFRIIDGGSDYFHITQGGNVGVSSSSPGSLFSIGNTNGINFSLGTSSFSTTGGLNISGGCYAVNGTCLTANNSGASVFDFTPNTFGSPASNATSTLIGFTNGIYALASSTIGNGNQNGGLTIAGGATTTGQTYFGGNVGIGTSSPQGLLAISDNASNANINALLISSSTPTGSATLFNVSNTGTVTINAGASGGQNFTFGANVPLNEAQLLSNSSNLELGSNVGGGSLILASGAGVVGAALTSGGNFGIGTTSPNAKLVIAGNTEEIYGSNPAYTLYSSGAGLSLWNLQVLDSNNDFRILDGSNDYFHITQGGSVGIGTSSPTNALDIRGNVAQLTGSNPAFNFQSLSQSSRWSVQVLDSDNSLRFIQGGTERLHIAGGSGNISIGTTSPYARLSIWGLDTASSTLTFNVVNSASTTVFAVFDGGNAQLSGTLTQSSDARLKTNVQSLDASTSLAGINSLSPVEYNWLDPNKDGTRQYGFIAQQVQQVFPNLVSTTSATALTPDGTLGLNYIGLISPIVSAIQTLSAEVTSLEATVAGFAESFTSKHVTATEQLCVGSTCINQQQLASLLALEGQQTQTGQVQISAPTSPTISGTTTPPSIDIQGNNPATINVGDTYTDLGAIVHDNQGHDLGYKTFLNGALVSNIVIDTTQVATDTIDYVATDTWGNTSTSTRTVIIEANGSFNSSGTTTVQ